MASGWDQAQKKVIRNNGRNTGSSIWDQDATATQDIDSAGHDVNDNTLADSISETLHIGGFNNMLADLNFGGFKGIAMADGVNPTDAVTKQQLDAVSGGSYLSLDGTTPMEANLPMGGFKVVNIAVGVDPTDAVAMSQYTPLEARVTVNETGISDNDTELADHETRIATLEGQTDYVADSFKSNGPIRHVLGLTAEVDVGAVNRTYVANSSGVDISFTNVPSGNDTDLGTSYQAEGQVVVWNAGSTSAAPTITTTNLGTVKTIGAPNDTNDAAQTLTYLMQWRGGALFTTLIWSAL